MPVHRLLTRDILHKHGLLQSIRAAGCCHDNALAESAFASLKAELPGAKEACSSKQAASPTMFGNIETISNRPPRQASLGFISPFDYL